MVKQERAARTRSILVKAAAQEFDRNGYEGTSLARVSRRAGISMGALTFHFASKADLADTVQSHGRLATRAAADRVRERAAPALQSIIDLTLSLARLLEEEAAVRASARLVRERVNCAKDWSLEWTPLMHELIARAQRGELRSCVDADTVAALTASLVAGAEAQVRRRSQAPEDGHESAQVMLARIWKLTLYGICEEPSVHWPVESGGTPDP